MHQASPLRASTRGSTEWELGPTSVYFVTYNPFTALPIRQSLSALPLLRTHIHTDKLPGAHPLKNPS